MTPALTTPNRSKAIAIIAFFVLSLTFLVAQTARADEIDTPPADVWDVGGWSTTSVSFTNDTNEDVDALNLSLAIVTAPSDSPEGPAELGPARDLRVFHMSVPGATPRTDVTLRYALGASDSYAFLLRMNETLTEPSGAVGATFFLPITYVDEAGIKHKPLALSPQYDMNEGTWELNFAGYWPIPTSSTKNYQLFMDGTYAPDGDTRGFVEVRHMLAPDEPSYVSLGVANLEDITAPYLGFGMEF